MSLIELFLLAVGLSMDAFAVSVCKGLSMQTMRLKHAFVIGLYFGGFQALMPWLGYLLGIRFQGAIKTYDHWIAFILLGIIGFNMVKESLEQDTESCDASVDVRTMLLLAIATSIDALAVGVTFAFLEVRIFPAIAFIGCTTFFISVDRSQGRHRVWSTLQIQGRTDRRHHSDSDRLQNPHGAPVLLKEPVLFFTLFFSFLSTDRVFCVHFFYIMV